MAKPPSPADLRVFSILWDVSKENRFLTTSADHEFVIVLQNGYAEKLNK